MTDTKSQIELTPKETELNTNKNKDMEDTNLKTQNKHQQRHNKSRKACNSQRRWTHHTKTRGRIQKTKIYN